MLFVSLIFYSLFMLCLFFPDSIVELFVINLNSTPLAFLSPWFVSRLSREVTGSSFRTVTWPSHGFLCWRKSVKR